MNGIAADGGGAPLILAIPSKGRLQENAAAFFARAGLTLVQPNGERTYRGRIAGLDGVEVAFLSAGEIASELGTGGLHLGVTGHDLIEETIDSWDARVDLTVPLGFGFADVVVAVPEAWIDVQSMADLDDIAADFRPRHGRRLSVATKFVHLTRRFFAAHGIADYRIVESLGATEGAPASGGADLIVDITTTGSTLKANNLKLLDDGLILRSEAHLVTALAATWGERARRGLRALLDRIGAEAAGRTVRELRADPQSPAAAARLAAEKFGARTPFGVSGVPLTLHCPAATADTCADWLRGEAGAATVTVSRVETVFSAVNPAYDRLIRRIEGGS